MKTVLQGLLAFHLMALQPVCLAAAFSVSPVRLHFTPRDRAVALTVVNEGDHAIRLEPEVMLWRQESSGADVLEASDDLIVSPPTIQLLPGAKQVVRVAHVSERDPVMERTYRLLVREVPPKLEPRADQVQLPIALVMSLPVFVTPLGARRQLDCDLVEPTALLVSCENIGTAYAQFRDIELMHQGRRVARFEGSPYLLPGARRSWSLISEPVEGAAKDRVLEKSDWGLVVRFGDGQTQSLGAARQGMGH